MIALGFGGLCVTPLSFEEHILMHSLLILVWFFEGYDATPLQSVWVPLDG